MIPELNHIKAMLFAAGLGTRLKPWTDRHPKALAPVAGKSLLQRNVEYLAGHGIRDLVVNVHHFPDQIMNAIREHEGWGSHIAISDERDEVLETGGGLLKAAPLLLGSKLILAVNSDILTNMDIHSFIKHHQDSGSLITLAVSDRPGSRKLLFDEKMNLCGWRHAETGAERIALVRDAFRPMSFSGISLMDAEVLSLIEQKGKFSLLDVFLSLAPKHKIAGYDHSGDIFLDVGKPESLQRAGELFGK